MTNHEQRIFVSELVNRVLDDLMAAVATKKLPPEWDGIELRQWIADQFDRTRLGTFRGARKRDYKNAVLVLGLLK
jgi:hypothetical protein